MKVLQFLSIMLIILTSCDSTDGRHSHSKTIIKDTLIPSPGSGAPTQTHLKTHLQDTTYTNGSFILFLRPNDARNAELDSISGELGGDGDADFGVGISNTLDSLRESPRYKDIKGLVSISRYVLIKDCIGGPLLIDRDTVNYGFIMSARGKQIDHVYNSVHSGDYREEIDSYFFGEGI
jgi:hypothetical protein